MDWSASILTIATTGAGYPFRRSPSTSWRFDTYCEISASGDGLRLFLFGTLPPLDRKEGDIEVYSDKRFLSVSGRHFAGTPMTINQRQAALDAMHAEVFAERIARRARVRPPRISSIVSQSDEELFERIRRSAHGEKFFKL
jgi:putative DNA primase/helicase